MGVREFERVLFPFLQERRYVDLGWDVDKRVRDTGPFLDHESFGTHPAVRVYYSPEVIAWLEGGRVGEIPDGAMIVKEQFEAPAARHLDLPEPELLERLRDWTVMIKDSRGSRDGWFWSNPGRKQEVVDNHQYPFDYPVSGFGLYCIRCHASTTSPAKSPEFTFASLRNIRGFPGEPVIFRVDDSWRRPKLVQIEAPTQPAPSSITTHPKCTPATRSSLCEPRLDQELLRLFSSIPEQPRDTLLRFPPITHDTAQALPGAGGYVSSDQCMSCHAGLVGPFGPAMFVAKKSRPDYADAGWHVSPYGEWRWSPMGLAGRDPVFHSQLESELALLERDVPDPARRKLLSETLVDTCLSCHGAMGKRQFDADRESAGHPPHFSVSHFYNDAESPTAPGGPHARYGALARDGISCGVCHRIVQRPQPESDRRPYLRYFLETSITGNFASGPGDELGGPFKDNELSPYAMQHATGVKPKHNPYLQSSQLCGSCHVINLPVVDMPHESAEHAAHDQLTLAEQNPVFREFHHHVEQATYLEWLNSQYENELNPANPLGRSCQDCHMPRSLEDGDVRIEQLQTRIAAVQDDTYPEAENLAPLEQLRIRYREQGYRRHTLQGLNHFLLEMFNQFDDVLGVRKVDFMTGSSGDLAFASRQMVQQATRDTADLRAAARWRGEQLEIGVEVVNKAGHRFPSGVGFRRAVLEVLVYERPESAPIPSGTNAEPAPQARLVWSSGRINDQGAIVDEQGRILPTEFFEPGADGRPRHQPHHERIDSSQQAQIYEHLMMNAAGQFTTSFVRQSKMVKDNRLLPKGWRRAGPDPAALQGKFLEATWPAAEAALDPLYQDGSGADRVLYAPQLPPDVARDRLEIRVSLHYQSIPPYFLRNLFETAPEGPATRRLHYLVSNLDLRGTPIEGWKLTVATRTLRP